MEFAEVKRSILSEVVRGGFNRAEDLPANLLTDLPLERVQRWLDRFWKSPKPEWINSSPRLVNHFALGADPEFCFTDGDGHQLNAMDYGLHAGLAFGMDNNGRLVELRPAPSRFALEVVASILSELRWLALLAPVRDFQWVARPYVGHDGLGGHVHFGRKRDEAFREREIKTLDKLTALLGMGGVFSKEGMAQRKRANGNYGQYGDVRPQKHGYEYRTMPTWLDSPWLAYLTLTLAKLLVHDPSLIPAKQDVNVKRYIRNLLAYYKPMDDDALIAYNALNTLGLPQQTGTDFKMAWGLNYLQKPLDIEVVPSVIQPTEQDKQAIFDYLRTGRPIYPDVPEPNWTPTVLPHGYKPALSFTITHRRPGMGELIHDLAVWKGFPVTFNSVDHQDWLYVIAPAGTQYPKQEELKELLPDAVFQAKTYPRNEIRTIEVRIGERLRNVHNVGKLKKFLLKGFLPLWKVGDVKPDSFEAWERTVKPPVPEAPKIPKAHGKEITKEVYF